MQELAISNHYPAEKYNLLGNTDVVVEVPDIMSPVIQVIRLKTDPNKGEVYLQEKGYKDRPDKFAITKNGLGKLAEGAGIKMVSSEHVIPSTCQKCVAINQHSGKIVQCGMCGNQDVAYRVTVSVPQLTGKDLLFNDTHEIIVRNTTEGMSEKQKAQFMKHLPQICEAKALNGAIRTALHVKGTYTLAELQKPFVVAYLVPNLNNKEVKQAALANMFPSSSKLFGAPPSVQQIESRVPAAGAIEASDGEYYDEFIDADEPAAPPQIVQNQGYAAPQIPQNQQAPQMMQPTMTGSNGDLIAEDLYCDKCGERVSDKVYEYSINRYGRPLCIKCQKQNGR